MSLEALWSVEFQSGFGMRGTGIAVFETGRVFGGDSLMIYTGSFRVENETIISDLAVERYASVPGMSSIMGLDKFKLKLTGPVGDRELVLQGYVVEDPSKKITIKAIRRADLP